MKNFSSDVDIDKIIYLKDKFEPVSKEIMKVIEICHYFSQRSEDSTCDTSNWFKVLTIFYKMEFRIKEFITNEEEIIEIKKLMSDRISYLFESMSDISSIQFVIKVRLTLNLK